jgi:hypothetical protein
MAEELSPLEQKNKTRLININMFAREVLPQVSAVVLNSVQRQMDSLDNPEKIRALRKQAARTIANISFDIGEAFLDEWKKKKAAFKLPE